MKFSVCLVLTQKSELNSPVADFHQVDDSIDPGLQPYQEYQDNSISLVQ